MAENCVNRSQGSSWIELGRELKKRTREPFFHASFVIYFLVAVVIIGGIGFWIELYAYLLPAGPVAPQLDQVPALRTAVITFFPALAGSACLQLVWAEDHQKPLRAFGILFLCLMTVIALAISPTHAVGNRSALVIGFLSSIAALWTWWIANARQKDLLDINAPLGGSKPDAELPGNLDGFTH